MRILCIGIHNKTTICFRKGKATYHISYHITLKEYLYDDPVLKEIDEIWSHRI